VIVLAGYKKVTIKRDNFLCPGPGKLWYAFLKRRGIGFIEKGQWVIPQVCQLELRIRTLARKVVCPPGYLFGFAIRARRTNDNGNFQHICILSIHQYFHRIDTGDRTEDT
jgi:hypothetical protein